MNDRINWQDNPVLVQYLDNLYVACRLDADLATTIAMATLEGLWPELEGRLTLSKVHWQFDNRRLAMTSQSTEADPTDPTIGLM